MSTKVNSERIPNDSTRGAAIRRMEGPVVWESAGRAGPAECDVIGKEHSNRAAGGHESGANALEALEYVAEIRGGQPELGQAVRRLAAAGVSKGATAGREALPGPGAPDRDRDRVRFGRPHSPPRPRPAAVLGLPSRAPAARPPPLSLAQAAGLDDRRRTRRAHHP